jgi:glycosyltransferase involved in cell wall biosynthesis
MSDCKTIVYFHQSSLGEESSYRGIGTYTRNLIDSLKRLRVGVHLFSHEDEVTDASAIVHYPAFYPYFITIPMTKKNPRVITVHDLIPVKFPHLYPPGIRGKIRWRLNKKIIQQADAIITDSLTSKNDILTFCWPIDARKIDIVPLAVDPIFKPIKNPRIPKTLRLDNSNNLKRFVLYVGDINPSKNLPLLVKACLELKIPLVMVGNKLAAKDYDRSHPENQDLVFVQKMVKKYPETLFCPGFIDQKDLVILYNQALVYCQPSFEEGFGLPVLEAMSCGCPVAISQTSSLVELTQTDAFLFDPNSKESIVNALGQAIDNKEKRAKIRADNLIKSRNYSWTMTACQTLAVYSQMIDNTKI